MTRHTEVFILFTQRTSDAVWLYYQTYTSKLGVRKAVDKMPEMYGIRVFKVDEYGSHPMTVKRRDPIQEKMAEAWNRRVNKE